MSEEQFKYRARAKEWSLGYASTGTPQVAVYFEFLDEGVGGGITWFGFLSEKALESTVRGLRNCGWEGDELADLTGLDKNEVELVVEMEEYNGQTRPKVRWVNRAGGAAVKNAMGEDEAKAFSANLRARIRAIDAQEKVKAKASGAAAAPTASRPPAPKMKAPTPIKRSTGAQAPEPPPHTDSDIPF